VGKRVDFTGHLFDEPNSFELLVTGLLNIKLKMRVIS